MIWSSPTTSTTNANIIRHIASVSTVFTEPTPHVQAKQDWYAKDRQNRESERVREREREREGMEREREREREGVGMEREGERERERESRREEI